MFGLNFGASLVPYLTTLVWNRWAGPETLIVVIFLSMFLPLPLLHATKYLSYDPAVNPLAKAAYQPIPDSAAAEAAEAGSGSGSGSGAAAAAAAAEAEAEALGLGDGTSNPILGAGRAEAIIGGRKATV